MTKYHSTSGSFDVNVPQRVLDHAERVYGRNYANHPYVYVPRKIEKVEILETEPLVLIYRIRVVGAVLLGMSLAGLLLYVFAWRWHSMEMLLWITLVISTSLNILLFSFVMEWRKRGK